MKYTTTGGDNTEHQILNDLMEPIGTIIYGQWRQAKARVEVADANIYEMEPSGFWRTSIYISKNGMPYGEVKNRWGDMTITIESGQSFTFRRKGFWNVVYVLRSATGETDLATVRSDFSWRTFGFNYEVEIDSIGDRELNLFMPFLLIFCVRMQRRRAAAV
jgi:hypothetical protein